MPPPPPGRFLALDGMRGVAALSVLVFHLFWNTAGSPEIREWLPEVVVVMTGFMRSGVAIFFVISGFVIAHTTLDIRAPGAAGRFALRRQIRLDPPYYVMIVVVVVIEYVQSRIPGLVGATFTLSDILVNALYLQDILGRPSILAVAWTLCLEVQFYLVVMVVSIIASMAARSDRARLRIIVGASVLLSVVSLAAALFQVGTGPWVIGLWWMFGIGMVLAWDADGIVSAWFSAASIIVLVVWAAAMEVAGRGDPWGGGWFAIATAAVVFLLIRRRALARSPGKPLLFAGRLSYSLYLVHLPVIILVTGAALKLWPGRPWVQLAVVPVAALLAVLAAELLHRFAEVPAITWSKRLRRVPRAASGEVASG